MNSPNGPSIFRRRVPRQPLCRYVQCLWYSAGYHADHKLEKVLPTGTVQLVIRLHQDPILRFDNQYRNRTEFAHAIISGAHSQPFVKGTYRPSCVVGVHFRPAGASLFFDESFGQLTNLNVDAEQLWGPQLRELREQLLEAQSPETAFDLLEDALLDRLTEPTDQWNVVSQALERLRTPAATVRQVGDASGYSPRHFIKLFEHHVGLTPKMFCRVTRFQNVLQQISRRETIDWAGLALNCGYFDQSHLIRDFREFANICPSEYRPAHPNRRIHIAVNS